MNVKTVGTVEELRKIWVLTHDAYVRAGLIEPRIDGRLCHRPEYDLFDDRTLYGATTVAYVTGRSGDPVATVSATVDTVRGLPDEATFPEEIAGLRRECQHGGLVLANQWRIVAAEDAAPCAKGLMFDWSYDWGVREADVVVIACHPRHAKLYVRMLGFVQVAERDCETGLLNAPAVLLRWNRWNDAEIWPKTRGRAFCSRWN